MQLGSRLIHGPLLMYKQHISYKNNQQNSSHMDSALRSGSPWNTAV